MFTGIIEEVGTIAELRRARTSARISVRAPLVSSDAAIGDSVSISGACLTVVARVRDMLSFDAIPETIERTSLKQARAGARVNLERALAVGQRFGGHFVQGHVDGTGAFVSVREAENAHILRIDAGTELTRYMVQKGSVALDGISLTIVDLGRDWFTVWIIPHTWDHTTLSDRKPGDLLNIEVDLIARHIERLLAMRQGDRRPETADRESPSPVSRPPSPGVTAKRLAEAGFIGSDITDL